MCASVDVKEIVSERQHLSHARDERQSIRAQKFVVVVELPHKDTTLFKPLALLRTPP